MKESDFAVLGLGMIGGSLGAALRADGHHVRGFDLDPRRGEIALERGLVDTVAANASEVIKGATVVLLAVPLGSIVDLLPLVDAAADADALLLDVGSVKAPVVAAMAALPRAARAIGGHPIAGSERSGPEAADADLLRGHVFVLCPTAKTDRAHLERAEFVAGAVGMHSLVMDAEEHDRVLARTSHLPQLVSSALAAGLASDDTLLAGPGLRDMTRLAASDPTLWRDIVALNRGNVRVALERFQGEINHLLDALDNQEDGAIEEMLRAGAKAREALAV